MGYYTMVSRQFEGENKAPDILRDERDAHTLESPEKAVPADSPAAAAESDATLEYVLIITRWVTIASLFLLSIAQPLIGRIGLPTWTLILGFAIYSAVLMLLRRRFAWLRPYSGVATLDLLVVSALYSIAASPGGPIFVLFLLLTVSASCTTTMPRSLLYTAGALAIITIVSPTLPQWTHDARAIRDLVGRLIVVVLANAGTILLFYQLNRERAVALETARSAERQGELHRMREVFIASISHDLRTPLTALQAGLGMLQLSLDDRMRGDEQHLLGTARRNSERLSFLVNDLLTYNQLEMGALQLDYDRMDLSNVVRCAVSAITPLLQQKSDTVEMQINDSQPYIGDTQRIEQMLINLLANACEHTPMGTTIRIASEATSECVLLSISDDGTGIPPEQLEHIFQPFHRINLSHPGSGLGLAIARRIAELHGGDIWAENRLDGTNAHGTTFSVTLPIRTVEDAQCP